jgi:hypothetical protein
MFRAEKNEKAHFSLSQKTHSQLLGVTTVD